MNSTFMNTTLTGIMNDKPNNSVCSFMRCMTCPHEECWTGQQARNHGRRAYDAVIHELEAFYSEPGKGK